MVAIGITIAVIRAETFLADGAGGATSRTKISLTIGTWFDSERPPLTAWTFDQTGMTISCVVNCFIEAGANDALAGCTTDQTVPTEALTAGATYINFGAILFTARAAYSTLLTNVGCFTGCHFDLIEL